ncbi:MAG: UdgX family uracil-DNA binding protein [Chloroflexi bacterium]|nr:UdgX family uracil-DNA binding protein [Chloroflexota bacterium]
MAVRQLPLEQPFKGAAERERALEQVRRTAARCRACPLWEIGTQTVFGVGPATARLVLIGEAPGYQEDQQGMPFVGPAGKLLDEALAEAGLSRPGVYITNIVKHRPWVPGGAHGKNRPPRQSEITACRPWLAQELAIVRPRIIGCLGALAAREILGKGFRLTEQRGQWFEAEAAPHVLATIHPSYVLIQPHESHDRLRAHLFSDLRRIAERYRQVAAEEAASGVLSAEC